MANKFTSVVNTGDFVGIPTNVLKLHTNDVIFAAMPAMRFDQFAVVRTDLQTNAGDTIVFSKYGNLSGGGVVAEEDDIESKSLSKTTVSIVVTEYGNAVGLTSKLMTLSFLDEMQNASITLGRNYATVTDKMLRDALFAGTQVEFCGDNTAQDGIASGDTLKKTDVSKATETLLTGNVMKYVDANGEYYVGYLHPHSLTSLKTDMISVHQYSYPELIYKGEVGEVDGVRWITSTLCPNGAGSTTSDGYDATLISGYEYATGHTNAVALYKTAVFGMRAYGWAVALPVELRQDPGQTNFGRKVRVAWYTIQGAGIINNENIVILLSA